MKKSSILIVVLVAISIFSFANLKSFAADYNPIEAGDIEQQLSLSATPSNPKRGDTVTFTVSAYGTNLNSATISWSVGGRQIQKDVGLTTFTLQAGKNGDAQKVTVVVSSTNSPSISKSITVSSQEVSLIYEASSYTPPFYKGKGLFTKEGDVTFIALPNLISNGTRLNPKNLIYKWIINDTVQGSMSGYGKNTFAYTSNILGQDVLVEVQVSSIDGTVKGNALLIISPNDPVMLFYERSPLYGTLFNKELSTNTMALKDTEVSVGAFPYFSRATLKTAANLQYSWTINGDPILIPKSQSYATFRNSTNQKGSTIIGALFEDTERILQGARGSLTINF